MSTVLILGAGASMPYGFPSGHQLTTQIIEKLNTAGWYLDIIQNCGFKPNEIDDFRNQLERSHQASIDAFLEHRYEFIDMGKTCIALTLIPYEKEDQLGRNIERHWYAYLFRKLTDGIKLKDFNSQGLSVITFNYDRSLEQFLFGAAKNTYGLSDSETATLVRKIPIIHVHGCLGKLPALHGTGRAYVPLAPHDVLRQCAQEIKIVHEDLTDNPEWSKAHELIRDASTICFLGFGYHRVNIDRLFLPEKIGTHALQHKKLLGTTFKMMGSETASVLKRFKQLGASLEGYDCDALQAFGTWNLLD